MKKYFRKGVKILGITALVLVILFLLTYFLIQIPRVQTWLVQKVTANLSETLQTKVEVKSVNIEFFKTAVLEGIYIEDQNADTLLFAQQLKADIGVFSLFQKEIFLNKVQLSGGNIHLSRKQRDSSFNFQFILDQLNPPSTDTTTTVASTSSPWSFGIGNIRLDNIHFDLKDQQNNGYALNVVIGNLEVHPNTFDFNKQTIDLSKLLLEKSKVTYRIDKKTVVIPKDTSGLVFPNIGWGIKAEQIRWSDNQLVYEDLNTKRQADVVDFNHLFFSDISLIINDLDIKKDTIEVQIQQIALQDHSGFELKKLSGNVFLSNQMARVNQFEFVTPTSNLKNNLSLNFPTFGDLTDFLNQVKVESDFSESKISYRDLRQLIPAFSTIPSLNTQLREEISIFGKLLFFNDKLTLKNLDVAVSSNFILQADGVIDQLSTQPQLDIFIKKIKTDYHAVSRLTKDFALPDGLENWGKINFTGKIKGTIADLDGKQLALTTSGKTQFIGDLALKGLPDISTTIFSASIQNLTTRSEELNGFSASIPPLLDSLGVVNFIGNFTGKIDDFQLNGDFETTAGNLGTNISMLFQNDFSSAKYEGKLVMEKFDLGKILGEPFGKFSLTANMNGEGLQLDDLNTKINATIPDFVYQNYNYKNLMVNGSFFKKQFEGNANIQDENVAFDFFGKVDLNRSLPEIDMALMLDTINLKALNLYERDLGFSGFVKADLKGNNLDDLAGSASLNYFSVRQDSVAYSSKKRVSLKTKQDSIGNKSLVFRSKFMDADILGKYNFRELPDAIYSYVDEFFPVKELTEQDLPGLVDIAPKTLSKQDFDFDFRFKDIANITKVFVDGFSETDTASLKGHFDSEAKLLKINGTFPNIVFQDYSVDTLRIIAGSTAHQFTTDFVFSEVRSGSTFYFPKATLETVFGDDTLGFGLNIWEQQKINVPDNQLPFPNDSLINNLFAQSDSTIEKRKLQLGGKAFGVTGGYQMELLPTFVLNDNSWNIDTENYVFYDVKSLAINKLSFSKGIQRININSQKKTPENDFSPIGINFSNFNLSEVSDLLGIEDYYLDGQTNGDIVLKEPKNNLHYNGGLTVDSLSYNGEHLGILNITADQPPGESLVNVDVMLSGENEMTIIGNYAIQENLFDLEFDFKKLSFSIIDPFIKEIVKDSKGELSGKINLTGTPSQPIVDGGLQVKNLNTLVLLSNTRYTSDLATIEVNEKAFKLGVITLKDTKNNTATLTGQIKHEYFQNLSLDLNINTNAFQVLNTTFENNELYYGDLFLKATIKITGLLELPNLVVVAKTLPGSELYVQPFIQSLVVSEEDYIIFSNPNLYNKDSLQIVEQNISNNNNGFALTLNLDVTTDATLNIIIDPETGDQLTSVGKANFSIDINPRGDVSVVGNYTIDNGKYSMIYQQFIKRDFDIQKGSNIIFTGDPLKAKFNIIAEYNVRTTTLELIKNEATEAEIRAAQLRQNVQVLLKLAGDLEKPLVTFDLQMPDNQGEVISSAVTNKLAALRESPNELNKQVFGLLFFNSFMTSDQANSQFLTGTSEAIALSSVSKLLSNQLNKLADRYIKGVQVNFDLESYKSGLLQENTVTQMQLNVSKQLFNDRLSIKVGTNVNVNSNNSSTGNSDFSAIAGDFVIEYQLNEAGNYFVRVFHKSDFNILEEANTSKTGAGIIFRKSFNGKKYKE